MFSKHAVQGEQLGQSVLSADLARETQNLDNKALHNILASDTEVSTLVRSTCIGVILGARLIGKDGDRLSMTPSVHENLRTNHLLCYALDLNHTRENRHYEIFKKPPDPNATRVHEFAKKLLEHQYFLAMAAAAKYTPEGKKTGIVLTMLGGGSFGNNPEWIADAIQKAYRRFLIIYPIINLKIIIVYMFSAYGKFEKSVKKAVEKLHKFVSDFTKPAHNVEQS